MAAAPYNPGKPTLARPLGDNRFAMDSFRGESKSYTVTLGSAPTCTCPHFAKRLAGTGQTCKHIDDTRRQARFLKLLETAKGLTDADLARLLARYTELGNAEVTGALRCERHRRQQAAAHAAFLQSHLDTDTPSRPKIG